MGDTIIVSKIFFLHNIILYTQPTLCTDSSPYFLVEVGVSVGGGTGTGIGMGTGGRGGVVTSCLGVARAFSGWSLSTLSWYITPSR